MACILTKLTKMPYFDNHTHSTYSPDGKMTMEDAVLSSINTGLKGISVSDHYDIDIPGDRQVFVFNIGERNEKLRKLAEKYEGRITVMSGIEIGMQPHCIEKTKELLRENTFDNVIASVHFIEKSDPYFGEYYIGKEKKDAYRRYFESMYECMKKLEDFDILGHFDYIARYAPYNDRYVYYREFEDHIDAILKYLTENGKFLEINTKSYNPNDAHHTVLDTDIIKRYAELGGDAVSLGSDAHNTDRIGEGFAKYAAILKGCGIRYACRFVGRKPGFEKL